MGLLINIKSIKLLYSKLVKDEQLLKFILTYKLSQDHLEIFFSAVRSKGGINNNPTSRQFQAIMKRLLIHQEIAGNENANAVAMDNTSILHCSSASPKSNCDTAKRDSEVELSSISDEIHLNRNIWRFNDLFGRCNRVRSWFHYETVEEGGKMYVLLRDFRNQRYYLQTTNKEKI
nr:unnamed protein product [Callosobruchus analis]